MPAPAWRRLHERSRVASAALGGAPDLALSPSQTSEHAHWRRIIDELTIDGNESHRAGTSTLAADARTGAFDALLWGPDAGPAERLGTCADEGPLSATAALYALPPW